MKDPLDIILGTVIGLMGLAMAVLVCGLAVAMVWAFYTNYKCYTSNNPDSFECYYAKGQLNKIDLKYKEDKQ